jgi:hypothetical protein
MSTLTLEIPDEAEEIADLQEQLKWFVEEQVRIHQWRKRRYSSTVDEIVEGAVQEAERLKASGMSPEHARQEFVARLNKLAQ